MRGQAAVGSLRNTVVFVSWSVRLLLYGHVNRERFCETGESVAELQRHWDFMSREEMSVIISAEKR